MISSTRWKRDRILSHFTAYGYEHGRLLVLFGVGKTTDRGGKAVEFASGGSTGV